MAARTGLALLATLVTGACAHAPDRAAEHGALDRWLRDTAVPAVQAARAGRDVPVIIRTSTDLGTDTGPPAVVDLVAVSLAAQLERAGVTVGLGDAGAALEFSDAACLSSHARPLPIVILARPGVRGAPSIAIQSWVEREGRPTTLAVTELSERPPASARAVLVPPRRGTRAQPYAAENLDAVIEHFARRFRCDQLRVRWRTGQPDVSWDVVAPASWYRQLGLRVRDALARREGLDGAAPSGITIARLELSVDAVERDVFRVVVRATPVAGTSAADVVLWHEAYVRAPPGAVSAPAVVAGPPAAPTPVPPPVASAAAPPPHVTPAPPTAVPDRVRLPVLEDVHVLRTRAAPCVAADPWHAGAVRVDSRETLETGACIAFQISGTAVEGLYLLHRGDGGGLFRVYPSTCLAPEANRVGERVQIPPVRAGAPAIQLTPPGGAEEFSVVVLGAHASSGLREALASLPDSCAPAPRGPTNMRVVSQLDAAVARGDAVVRTVSLRHE
jgi:hypothetical protein